MKLRNYIILFTLALVIACAKDDDPDPIPVNGDVVFDLDAVPYPLLSDYRFYTGPISELNPNDGVIPYEVISPLFSDYAHKKRFIWMPEGVSASHVNDHQLFDYPDGTVFLKNFYYENVQPDDRTQILETRVLFKRNGLWEFAEYVWNAEQNEAEYRETGSYVPLEFRDDNNILRSVNYRIPDMVGGECLTCHKKNSQPIPIGPKPQNLNASYEYEDGSMNQLSKWIEQGYLQSNIPTEIVTTVDWTDTSQDLSERVRSYIDMNCGHCHAEGSHCDYRPMRFAYEETIDEQNLGVCVEPDEVLDPTFTHIVASGNINRSMLHFRFSSTDESVRMPLLGRSLVHDEALEMIEEWINSLSPPCN